MKTTCGLICSIYGLLDQATHPQSFAFIYLSQFLSILKDDIYLKAMHCLIWWQLSQNLKKSWHPSTMKNQERVWKAEQQKAEEDRKMAELQRELKEEREREVLKKTAEESGAIAKKGEEKLDWMYKVSIL